MIGLAHQLRAFLYPFLEIASAALALLLAVLLLHRFVVAMAGRRKAALVARYRPIVDRLVRPAPDPRAFDELAAAPRGHAAVIAELLLAPLVVTTGETRTVIHEACGRIGLDRQWRAELRASRWWRRADAARALGAIQDGTALDAIVAMLDDEHEEVRAGAIDALGLLQDVRALPALTALLSTPERHQRARVVEALKRYGDAAAGALIERAEAAPQDRVIVAELLGFVRAPRGITLLVDWLAGGPPPLRAASMQALGAIGLDERSFYYAVRALGDDHAPVRAAAARALGRARREDAAPYLVPLLDDDWSVAAQAALALRYLGASGQLALRRRAAEENQAGDLSRQMLWERRADGARA
jgi:hypothetical protein